MSKDQVDVLVLGGGPGGYSAAFHAAAEGFSVALVCDEDLGGVCLLRGCIPSKALLELAELRHRVDEAGERGLRFGKPEIDLAAIHRYRDDLIGELSQGLEGLCEKRKVQRIRGRGRFVAEDRLAYRGDDGEGEIGFRHAVIATGSRPQPLPPAEGIDDPRLMDSAGALELAEIPERLVIIGGGYIGLEMATVYHALGSEVTVLEMLDRVLAGTDEDLVAPLASKLRERVDLRTGTAVKDIAVGDDGLELTVEADDERETITADRVLVAIGRRPNSEDLGLADIGVDVGEDGYIEVDDQGRTSREHIFAIGDVSTDLPLAHVAMHEGRIAAEVIAGKRSARDFRARPAVVYTDPQIAWCGLTEHQAAESGHQVRVVRNAWAHNGRARSLGSAEGLTKFITDPDTGRILGMGIVGRQAESLIAEGLLAVELAATVDDLALTMHPHPTVTEPASEAAAGVNYVVLHGG